MTAPEEIAVTTARHCPICRGSQLATVCQHVPTINKQSGLTVALRRCTHCQHWFHDPIPLQDTLRGMYRDRSAFVLGDEIIEARQHTHFADLEPCALEQADTTNPRYAPCLELTHTTRINYLEIGCGEGQMLRYFLRKAPVCYGVEPGTWIRHPCIVNDIAQVPRNARFDVIVIYDVLEHVADPVAMMATCRSLANPGARIYCAFPNKDSLVARLRKEKWLMVRPFGHVHYFSQTSMQAMFCRAGWMPTKYHRLPTFGLQNIFRAHSLRQIAWEFLNHGDQWLVFGIAQ